MKNFKVIKKNKIADARTMNECWPGFHTFDVEMTIDDLKEIHRQRSYHISPAPGCST